MKNYKILLIIFLVVVILGIAVFYSTKNNISSPSSPQTNQTSTYDQLPATTQIQKVSIETLDQVVTMSRDWQAPKSFNSKSALGKIQKYVYAFPGYKYETLGVEMNDYSDGLITSKEIEQTKQQGEFLFNIKVCGSLSKGGLGWSCGGGDKDSYFFTLIYSEKNGTYTLQGGETLILNALPLNIRSKALKIAGVSESPSEMGWLRNTGGEFWYPGAKDGIVYIYVMQLDGSGQELAIKSSKTFYVDVFNGRLINNEEIKSQAIVCPTPQYVSPHCPKVITRARNIKTGEIKEFFDGCLLRCWVEI